MESAREKEPVKTTLATWLSQKNSSLDPIRGEKMSETPADLLRNGNIFDRELLRIFKDILMNSYQYCKKYPKTHSSV